MGKIVNLNLDWRFHLGDEIGADFMGWDDSAWRVVTLPHDWSVEHPFDRAHASGTGYLPGGTAWYRKHFTLPEDAAGKRIRVTFGGVYKHARVWINSNYLGERPYGYATFTHDITEFVRPGENVLCVRVEHEQVADSRWFTGSGIYRDVMLEISGMHGFVQDGVFVTSRLEADGTAVLTIDYETHGADSVCFLAKDASGNGWDTRANRPCGRVELRVQDPKLWSPEAPNLYTLVCRAYSEGDPEDEIEIPIGIRVIRFDGDKGFFLNGVSTKLKGVCVHHDGGALGAAVPKAVWARRLARFKAMGCNAIRTAHNPPDPHLLELCDEMGFLVMDEAFDEWQGHNVYPPKRFGYAEDFPQWHEADLAGMVKRDRNHPCVILWSIGNEIDYPNDPYVTPLFNEVLGNNDANKPLAERLYDARKPDAGRLAVVAKELTDIVHGLDTSRPVTSALSFPELSNRTGYADVLDVVGYNYKEQFYAEDHERYPGRVIYGSENGKDAKAWRYVRDNDYICGQFLWTGVDFLGECRGWPVRISQAGLINLAGYDKPGFWQRKAMWTDERFVKLAVGHADDKWDGPDTERFCWKDTPGRLMRVSCYTSAKSAELFLNGISLGVKPVLEEDGYRARWEVPFAPGRLTVEAEGMNDTLTTCDAAACLALKPDIETMPADGQSVAQVEVALLDAEGRPAAGVDQVVRYQLMGDAEIIGIENGRPDDLTPYFERHRATLDGRAVVYIRAGRIPDVIRLTAFTREGLRAEAVIEQK